MMIIIVPQNNTNQQQKQFCLLPSEINGSFYYIYNEVSAIIKTDKHIDKHAEFILMSLADTNLNTFQMFCKY